MLFKQSWFVIVALIVTGAFAVDCTAKPSVEERIEQIEKLVANKVTIETLTEIEALKLEVQALYGKLDEQQHAIAVLNKKQEKLFLDLEQRLLQLTKASGTTNIVGSATANTSKSFSEVKTMAINDAKSAKQPDPSISLQSTQADRTKPLSAAKANGINVESDLYNAAYSLVDSKRYQDALVAFQDFLWKYPEGQYAANANYWLGEIYLSEWHKEKTKKANLDKAIDYFKTVTINYPKHHKAADALFKLGLIETEQGNVSAAKGYFLELKKNYPNSSRVYLADAKLKSMK